MDERRFMGKGKPNAALNKIMSVERSAKRLKNAIQTTADSRLLKTCGLNLQPIRTTAESRRYERRLKMRLRREIEEEMRKKEEEKGKEGKERRKEREEEEEEGEKERKRREEEEEKLLDLEDSD